MSGVREFRAGGERTRRTASERIQFTAVKAGRNEPRARDWTHDETPRCGEPSLVRVTRTHVDPLAKRRGDARFNRGTGWKPSASPAAETPRHSVSSVSLSVTRQGSCLSCRLLARGAAGGPFLILFLRQGGFVPGMVPCLERLNCERHPVVSTTWAARDFRASPYYGRLGVRAGSFPGVPRAAA